MRDFIRERLLASIEAKQLLFNEGAEDIIAAARLMARAIAAGNKVMACGNGGSAADAQHLAAEFVNRFIRDRRPLAAMALTCDTSIITSIGNDFDYSEIFAKQVTALGREGDVLLAISTSGTSANVVAAVEMARGMGVNTVALTGGSGGKLKEMSDITINVPVEMTPHIQEAHLWVEHLLCWLVDEIIFGDFAEGVSADE